METLKTYREFSDEIYANYRTNHPNSTPPRPSLISDFYDQYLKENGVKVQTHSEWIQEAKEREKIKQSIFYISTPQTPEPIPAKEPAKKTIQEYKIESTLKVKVRYSEGIMTRAEWCELQKRNGANVQEVQKSKTKYNRVKYNRMGPAEQEEYERKLNTLVTCYELHLPSGCFYDITKAEYDYFNSL